MKALLARSRDAISASSLVRRPAPGGSYPELIADGELGDIIQFSGRYWADYARVARIPGLPPCADFRDGLRGLKILAAIAESARSGGIAVPTA